MVPALDVLPPRRHFGHVDGRIVGEIGPPEAVLPTLRALADDPDAVVSAAAVETLGTLRPAADAVLRELLHHPDERIRSTAEVALQDEEGSG